MIGPTWSSDRLRGTTPLQDKSPNDGLKPTTPQAAAGILIEPPVSFPMDANEEPAATEAAEPLLEPPGDRPRS